MIQKSEKKKKVKNPQIYDDIFTLIAEDSSSKVWSKICINVLFLEMLISNTINVKAYHTSSDGMKRKSKRRW